MWMKGQTHLAADGIIESNEQNNYKTLGTQSSMNCVDRLGKGGYNKIYFSASVQCKETKELTGKK